jgi:parallel beta-helix repeat protein
MNKTVLFLVCASILLLLASCARQNVVCRAAWVVDLHGDGDFVGLQEAVNAASPGDVIVVTAGIFYEHVVLNKSVALHGENRSTCIIDGNGTGTVVTVNADCVEIMGFTIQQSGDRGVGILLDRSDNNTIQGNMILSNYYGVWLNDSESNLIKDNLVHGNVWGIGLEGSQHNVFEENIVSYSHLRGLHFRGSSNNMVHGTNLTNNGEGIYLEFSSNNTLRSNNLAANTYGFGVLGSELGHYIHDIDVSNVVDDRPLCYWVNQHSRQAPKNVGYLAVVNSTGITIQDLNMSHQQEGPLVAYSVNSTIESLQVSNAKHGLRMISCTDLRVVNNNFSGNAKGIRLDSSVNNTIIGNVFADNHEAIFLDDSDHNVILGNTVIENIRGVFVYYSTHNIIYHNNFVDNEKHVFIAPAKILLLNSWHWSGEGNYWSNNTGSDSDQDGIANEPYILDETNQDNHPLMGQFYNFAVTSTGPVEHVTLVCNSTISDFVFAHNSQTISFSVTGTDGMTGFCRVTIPHNLQNGSYEVFIDGAPPLTMKTVASNSTHSIVYFTYRHSTRQIVIVPEFSVLLLLVFTVGILVVSRFRNMLRTSGTAVSNNKCLCSINNPIIDR